MTAKLLQIAESTHLDAAQVSARTAEIHATALGRSKHLDAPDFTCIHPDDLKLLFAEYDRAYFDGQISQTLGAIPLDFGLSRRMTSSGGKTARYRDRSDGSMWYEIRVSTTILYGPGLPGRISRRALANAKPRSRSSS